MSFKRTHFNTPTAVTNPHTAVSYPASSPDTPPAFIVPAPPRARRWRQWRWFLGGIMVMFLTAFLAVGAAVGFFFYGSDQILPGVTVLDVPVGGHSPAEAEAMLASQWQTQAINLTADETMWVVSPEQLGITLDVESTIAVAYEQGRSVDSLIEMITRGQMAIVPVWYIDPTVAEATFHEVTPYFDKPPVNAGVKVVAGRAEAVAPQAGQTLNVAATMTQLEQQAAQAVTNGRFALVMDTVEPTVADVSAIVDQTNQLLSTSLHIRAYDPIVDASQAWMMTPDVWGEWITIGAIDPENLDHFSWAIDEDKMAHTLTTYATLEGNQYLDASTAVTAITQAIVAQQSAVTLRIYHHDQTHTVQAGETLASIGRVYGIPYPWIQQANPSVGDSLTIGQTILIPSPDAFVPLPVVENKRIVISISQQTVWVYEDGQVKWEWSASTGIASSPTAPGIFQIQSHEENAYAGNWNLWMPSFMGIYRPVPGSDFMNGLHGFPTRGGAELLWTGDLGHPVTYGCILISSANAELLYEWADEGVVVEIQS